MAVFVSLLALDGSAIEVNPEQVCALLPIPTELLPVGVADGTYVDLQGNADGGSGRVAVQGTVAATAAALAAGTGGIGGSIIGFAFIDPGTATVFIPTGILVGATVVENAPGDASVTMLTAPPAGSVALFSTGTPDCVATLNGPLGLGFDVETNTAGAPASAGFTVVLFAPPA